MMQLMRKQGQLPSSRYEISNLDFPPRATGSHYRAGSGERCSLIYIFRGPFWLLRES